MVLVGCKEGLGAGIPLRDERDVYLLVHLESPGMKSYRWLQSRSIIPERWPKEWPSHRERHIAATDGLASRSGQNHEADPEPAFTPWSRHPRLGALQRVFQSSPSTPLIPIPLSPPLSKGDSGEF